MQKYRNLHLWLLLPFALTLWGFFPSYWHKFSSAHWLNHLHGLSATSWYVFVILQPYLATRGNLALHRKLGLVGLILAGVVTASALATIPGNIAAAHQPGDFPVAPDAFLYGISLFDLISILGFVASVTMGVLKAKQMDDHAVWMASTVFWPIMAAIARIAVSLTIMARGGPAGVTFINVIWWINGPYLLLLGFLCWRTGRAHPAYLLLMLLHFPLFFLESIGNNPAWRAFCDAVFTVAK